MNKAMDNGKAMDQRKACNKDWVGNWRSQRFIYVKTFIWSSLGERYA